MTDRNQNNKQRQQKNSIKNHLKTNSPYGNDFKNIPSLYGMTLEEYEEGAVIHSRCFDQLKNVQPV